MPKTDFAEATPTDCDAMRHTHRGPDDDFFCLRYQVWYPSFDCAIRTKFRTSPGCLCCQQGRFNLRRHEHALPRGKWISWADVET